MALSLSQGDKRRAPVAVEVALSELNGLMPYESEKEKKIITRHLQKKVLARLNWEEDVRRRRLASIVPA
jgi:hypothetical protein